MEKTAFGREIISYLGDVDIRGLELIYESTNEYITTLQHLDPIMTYVLEKYPKMSSISYYEYSEEEKMKIRIQYLNDEYYGIQLIKNHNGLESIKTFYLTIMTGEMEIYDYIWNSIDLSLFCPLFIYHYFSNTDFTKIQFPSKDFVIKMYENFGGDNDLDTMLKDAIIDKYHFMNDMFMTDSIDHFLEPIHDTRYIIDDSHDLFIYEEDDFDSDKSL